MRLALYCFLGSFPATGFAANHSFDIGKGLMAVDSTYFSKHDLVYGAPNSSPAQAIPVANGKVGAMIWNDSGLTMQVTNVDASPQTQISSGLGRLLISPSPSSQSSVFEQRLNLYDGMVTQRIGNGFTATVFASDTTEMIGIHIDDLRPGVTSVIFELALWTSPIPPD